MAAAITDKFKKGYGFFSTTLSAQKNSGASSMSLSDATGVPTTTGLVFTVGRVNSSGTSTPSTRAIYKGTLSGTTVSNLTLTEGTDQTHAAGTVVEITFTATHWNDAVDGITAEHNQDGTHSDITADSVEVSGDVEATSFTVTGQTTGLLGAVRTYTYDGTDIFINGVDQNNAANTTTWSKPTNLKFVEVEVVGGGGGGGGTGSTTGSTSASAGGGGAGGYSFKKIAVASLGATETITVGALGAGASAGANSGSAGGTTSFGSHLQATGGSGGAGDNGTAGNNASAGGAGGVGSSGDINLAGDQGTSGRIVAGSIGYYSIGSASKYGSTVQITGTSGDGVAGKNYGSGGSGAASGNSTGTRPGGAGTAGLVIVKEYF